MKAMIIILILGASTTIAPKYIIKTIERFENASLNQDDTNRGKIALYSYQLLMEYFPFGIGLGGFSYLSSDVIPYTIMDARGNLSSGANLHNSYMTWALEGGWSIMSIVLILFVSLFKIIHLFISHNESKTLGIVILIWAFSGMFFAFFHQWHNTWSFLFLFGYTFGCSKRYGYLQK